MLRIQARRFLFLCVTLCVHVILGRTIHDAAESQSLSNRVFQLNTLQRAREAALAAAKMESRASANRALTSQRALSSADMIRAGTDDFMTMEHLAATSSAHRSWSGLRGQSTVRDPGDDAVASSTKKAEAKIAAKKVESAAKSKQESRDRAAAEAYDGCMEKCETDRMEAESGVKVNYCEKWTDYFCFCYMSHGGLCSKA